MYTNAQGFRSKLPELRLFLQNNNLDLIAITESWLTEDILDCELILPGMTLLRNDRPTPRGGVLLYVNDKLQFYRIDHEALNLPDTLWCKVCLQNGKYGLFAVIYRSPSSDSQFDIDLLYALRVSMSFHFTYVLIMGDFNAPTLFNNPSGHPFTSSFFDFIVTTPLYNHVTAPTRRRNTDRPSILDLILTNEELMVENVTHFSPFGRSDHDVLLFNYICQATFSSYTHVTSRRYTSYVDLKLLVQANSWEFLNRFQCQEAWNQFVSTLNILVAACSTVHTVKPARKPSNWIRSRTRKWLHLRQQAWHFYIKQPNALNWKRYTLLRNHCTSLLRADKQSYQSSLLMRFELNPKLLYKHINNLRQVSHRIPSLRIANNVISSVDDVVNVFREHYAAIFDVPICDTHFNLDSYLIPPSSSFVCLSDVVFTADKVSKKLLSLRTNSSPGIDELHPKVLSYLAAEFASPLAKFFQNLFSNSCVPEMWKIGLISPVYKGGDRSNPSSYRPVTLLPVLSKVMEAIVADDLMEFLETNGILSTRQHGFRKGYSCLTNLLLARDDWTKAVDDKYGVDVIYLDFSKAFDRVHHEILLRKLYYYGIRDPLLAWLRSYLSDRKLMVRISGHLSRPLPVRCGVPQGSVLGPRLFLVFINDLQKDITSNMLMFADDVKLWQTLHSPSDCQNLQNDLDRLFEWSLHHSLPFNTDKCKVLSLRHDFQFPYHLGQVVLHRVREERDLGIYIQNDLGCSTTCRIASDKALKHLGLLRRSFGRFEPSILPSIYMLYMRPHIEYALQVWQPWLKRDLRLLELPLRKATRCVRGLESLSYQDRLFTLNLFSTFYRGLRGDMILVYQILNLPNHPCRSLLRISDASHLRGHNFKLCFQYSRLECRRNFFSLRICKLWNILPPDVVQSTSLTIFKKKLDQFLISLHFIYA